MEDRKVLRRVISTSRPLEVLWLHVRRAAVARVHQLRVRTTACGIGRGHDEARLPPRAQAGRRLRCRGLCGSPTTNKFLERVLVRLGWRCHQYRLSPIPCKPKLGRHCGHSAVAQMMKLSAFVPQRLSVRAIRFALEPGREIPYRCGS